MDVDELRATLDDLAADGRLSGQVTADVVTRIGNRRRRTRRTVVAIAAAGVLVGAVGTAVAINRSSPTPTAHVTISEPPPDSCPSKFSQDVVRSSSATAPTTKLAWDDPVSGVLCRYYALGGSTARGVPHGTLYGSAVLSSSLARRAVTILNGLTPGVGERFCTADFMARDLLILRYARHAEVKIVASSSGCLTFTNGRYGRASYSEDGSKWVSFRNSLVPTVEQVPPQLPQAVEQWLRHYAGSSVMGKATSADWVLTTHGKAFPVVGGLPTDTTPVYLFVLHGHFVWDHSCPAGASPAACESRGTAEIFTFDPKRSQILDFTVGKPVDISPLGPVGHISLG